MEEHSEDAAVDRGQRDALFGPASSRRPVAGSSAPASSTQGGGSGGGDGWHAAAAAAGGATAGGPQGQQQQLSWAEVRGRIDVVERQRGLRSAYESVEVGRGALENLDDQREKLDRSEMMLDSTRYAIERSVRVLRGMTFWGKIRNAFSDDPQIPQPYSNSSNAAAAAAAAAAGAKSMVTTHDDESPAEGFICPDCRRRFLGADALVAHFELNHTDAGSDSKTPGAGAGRGAGRGRGVGWVDDTRLGGDGGGGRVGSESDVAFGSQKEKLFDGRGAAEAGATGADGSRVGGGGAGGGIIGEQKAVMAAQDAHLDAMGRAVTELGLLGRNIGASLDAQGGTLERVVEKTEDANDRTAFVTRKAARQAQSSKPKKPTFLMSVALQEVSSGLFLTVTGGDVVLQETELRNVCRFEAWQRQDGIIGLKSGVTRRWLGQTWHGYLRVTGTSFGKNYEWQGDLRRKETTLVCCSANWGAGGYLSARPSANNENNAGTNNNPPPSTTSGAGASSASGPDGSRSTRSAALPPPLRTVELVFVDATLANRHRAAVFRVVNCDDYTPQPFVGGRLMRNPAAPGSGGEGGGGWDAGGAAAAAGDSGWQSR